MLQPTFFFLKDQASGFTQSESCKSCRCLKLRSVTKPTIFDICEGNCGKISGNFARRLNEIWKKIYVYISIIKDHVVGMQLRPYGKNT